MLEDSLSADILVELLEHYQKKELLSFKLDKEISHIIIPKSNANINKEYDDIETKDTRDDEIKALESWLGLPGVLVFCHREMP